MKSIEKCTGIDDFGVGEIFLLFDDFLNEDLWFGESVFSLLQGCQSFIQPSKDFSHIKNSINAQFSLFKRLTFNRTTPPSAN